MVIDAEPELPYFPPHVGTRFTAAELIAAFDVDVSGPEIVIASLPSHHGGVLGSHLLGQQVMIAERLHPGRRAQHLQMVFLNSGRAEVPLTVDVEQLHTGRTLATVSLTCRQDDLIISRATVMLTAPEPDMLRGSDRAEPPSEPGSGRGLRRALLPWDSTEPPLQPGVFDTWLRAGDMPADPSYWRATVAHTAELFATQQALTDHGMDPAGGGFVGMVLAQTVTFVDEVDVRDWHRVQVQVPFAGAGRVIGYGKVWNAGGRLGATFETTALLRSSRRP